MIRLMTSLLFLAPLYGCQTANENGESPLPMAKNIAIIRTSCIVDQPHGIKRYTIVATHIGGFGEETIKLCQERFRNPKTSSEQEMFQAFGSVGEYEANATAEDVISCTVVKLSGIPTPLFFVSALEPGYLNQQEIGECLEILDMKLRNLPAPSGGQPQPPIPNQQPKFHAI